jgi:hypothetical protein
MLFFVFLVNCFVVALAVITHYEFLYHMSVYFPKINIKHRYRIVLGVFGALIAHTVEIWIFALAYFHMIKHNWGNLTGNFNQSLLDCGYFSFTVFSTVGFGDIEPVGNLRYLTGIESLTGLVLVTWSASFLYFQMQKNWDVK